MNKAILFVDDEILILTSMKAQVKKHYRDLFRYETASSAAEAWEIIEELKKEGIEIVLVISDWLMPNVKGDEFLIKVHCQFPKIKKVIISGQADPNSVENLMKKIELHAFVQKPWQSSTLIQTIESALV